VNMSYQVTLGRLLAQEAERLQRQIDQQQVSAQIIPWQVGDEGDRAMNQVEQSNLRAVIGQLRRKMIQVQAARARLDAGTYGICDDCSRPISPERLQAIPYATLCVTCQSKREHKKFTLSC
jgi:RNA polymerase-binding protein DksA